MQVNNYPTGRALAELGHAKLVTPNTFELTDAYLRQITGEVAPQAPESLAPSVQAEQTGMPDEMAANGNDNPTAPVDDLEQQIAQARGDAWNLSFDQSPDGGYERYTRALEYLGSLLGRQGEF